MNPDLLKQVSVATQLDISTYGTKELDDLQLEWMPPDRLRFLWKYGWARLSDANIASIANFTRDTGIVELGAGSGFTSNQLREKGCNIESFDNQNDMTYQTTWKMLPYSNLVKYGGLEEVCNLSSRALLMVWPHSGICKELLPVVAKFNKIIYVGEMWCTAENQGLNAFPGFFEDLAEKNFHLVQAPQDINNFSCQYGKLLMFEKGAPRTYQIPDLSYQQFYDRLANNGMEVADFFMKIKDPVWISFALYELKYDATKLEAAKKSHGGRKDIYPKELQAKYEKKIRECQAISDKLRPKS